MAREQARIRMGYFPAPPQAIAGILKHLAKVESERSFHLLDPCAGEGDAVWMLAQGLSIPETNIHAIELHAGRAATIKERIPDAKVLGPADFKATNITARSFGLVYANPPFDGEFGCKGRREEYSFARDAIRLTAEDGVCVLVVPYNALIGNKEFCELLDCQLKNIGIWRFPDGFRHFQEIVVIGYRRPVGWTLEQAKLQGMMHQAGFHWRSYGKADDFPQLGETQPKKWGAYDREEDVRVYLIPPTWKPSKFLKIGYTDEELIAAVNASGLNTLVEFVEPPKPRRPPLPPGKGHIAMLLASGTIDGVLFTPDGSHVVRGVARKTEYLNEEASRVEIDDESGEARIKEVISEKINLSVRAVGPDGVIHTFTDNPDDDKETDAGRGPTRREDHGQRPPGRRGHGERIPEGLRLRDVRQARSDDRGQRLHSRRGRAGPGTDGGHEGGRQIHGGAGGARASEGECLTDRDIDNDDPDWSYASVIRCATCGKKYLYHPWAVLLAGKTASGYTDFAIGCS